MTSGSFYILAMSSLAVTLLGLLSHLHEMPWHPPLRVKVTLDIQEVRVPSRSSYIIPSSSSKSPCPIPIASPSHAARSGRYILTEPCPGLLIASVPVLPKYVYKSRVLKNNNQLSLERPCVHKSSQGRPSGMLTTYPMKYLTRP